MHRVAGYMAAGWITLAGAVAAQDSPVVVELFTSQGCSSCPPADEILAELSERDDVIPLALHVDYWDYIGWKDEFAQHAFTGRQKAYARTGGWKMIYTPQMVVNGVDDVVGSRPMKLTKLIRKHAAMPSHVDLDVSRDGDSIIIRAEAQGGLRPCDIHVVRYLPQEQVMIARGENAGRTLTYTNIAHSWDVVARWDGRGVYEGTVMIDADAPVVVLVQDPADGHIVAAARLR
ncbi:DUF1223 domain-containing protein [Antarctobacter heliothermus]|uniref:Uncharacterized protein n=1 Tax=Antarctobacter heliothermus TaxID=74033 RepID=A0A239GHE7_9RHOB|nr:DUF1223 domain-containing protein [Antarctobacter heliothermus]SNS68559.1 hypothetical protein SAMN04488078_102651 [Antarctobacter heliothermus]